MFDTLTYDQQLKRLAEAADRVLPVFGLRDVDITPLAYLSNAVFAVDHRSGQYVLRIHRRDNKRREWIESEMRWLSAVRADAGLCVPQPVSTTEGALLAAADVDGLDDPLNCVLLTWVEGESLPPESFTAAQVEQVGRFLARLHNFSQQYTPATGFSRPKLDWEGLFGADSPYNPGAGVQVFQRDQVQVMDAVAERVREVMQALDAVDGTYGLIHADLIAKNILFAGDSTGVCAIDFDECAFGYYLYDMAPALLQFSPQANYAGLKEALWRGYTVLRPLPDEYRVYLETFVAGRHVASMRWIAGNLHNPRIRERAPQILADRTDELRDFLETGKLERKSEIF